VREYKIKIYINGRHQTIFGNEKSNIHPHTWELCLHITSKEEMIYARVKTITQQMIDIYSGKLLNDIYPFQSINPSTESIGAIFFIVFKKMFENEKLILDTLEIGENPSTISVISNDNISELITDKFDIDNLFNSTSSKEKDITIEEKKEDEDWLTTQIDRVKKDNDDQWMQKEVEYWKKEVETKEIRSEVKKELKTKFIVIFVILFVIAFAGAGFVFKFIGR